MTEPLHRVTPQELYESHRQWQQSVILGPEDSVLPAAWHLMPLGQQRVFEDMAERINTSHAPYKEREGTHYVGNNRGKGHSTWRS
jgi:hypothetical protein